VRHLYCGDVHALQMNVWKGLLYLCAYLNIRQAYLATAGQSLTILAVTLRIPPDSLVTRPRRKRLSWASICFQFLHSLAHGAMAI